MISEINIVNNSLFNSLPVDGSCLLVLDENTTILPVCSREKLTILTNRFDVHLESQSKGWSSHFSDFDFSPWSTVKAHNYIYYRISKEKAVVEHVLDSAWSCLPIGGQLCIFGMKQEGIKTFAKRCTNLWQCSIELRRGEGQVHCYTLKKLQETGIDLSNERNLREGIEKVAYKKLIPIVHWLGIDLFSKPGIFGWDRLDPGSVLLVEAFSKLKPNTETVLDLGCGYGLLSVAALKLQPKRLVATDNNAAALEACTLNIQNSVPIGCEWQVVPTHAGLQIHEEFDLVLCNPPFHQGFAVEGDLIQLFLEQTKRLLTQKGQALFVVNSFIPVPAKASPLFSTIELISDDGRYRVYRLQI
jgi:16S rRNA (guanine1207-N2)-methyltransferase